MKLTKISLAALVALGAFSSVASATPLEEAIKNVDLSGMARYRYTNTYKKESKNNVADEKKSKATHQFRVITNFKAAIDDNFFGVIGLRYNTDDGSGDNAGAGTDKALTEKTFNVYQFYLGYKVGNTTITAGKQLISSYFTNDAVGTGIRVVNKDIEGLTLTALAFDAIEGEKGWSNGELYDGTGATNFLNDYDVGNLYAAGIAGSYDPVNFQLWYASLTNLANVIAVDVSGNFAITNDVSLGARLNYAHSQADTSAKNALDYEDGNFYAGELSTSLFGFDLAAGYIGYKTQNYQDGKYSVFSFEDQGGLIDAGEDVLDWTRAEGKGSYLYVTSAYKFDKFTVGLDYLKGSYKTDEKTKIQQFVPRFAYQYNKKLTFSSFYAFGTEKEHDGDKNKANKFRFEAKYSF